MKEFYDSPVTVYGELSWQLCLLETQCGRYCQPFLANSIPLPINCSSVIINQDGSTSLDDIMQECEYCRGLGLHHIEDNKYWACRNCKMTGYIENE